MSYGFKRVFEPPMAELQTTVSKRRRATSLPVIYSANVGGEAKCNVDPWPSTRWQGRLALLALPRVGHARGKVQQHRVLGARAAQVVAALAELRRRARYIELAPLRRRAEAVVRRVHDPHERQRIAAAATAAAAATTSTAAAAAATAAAATTSTAAAAAATAAV